MKVKEITEAQVDRGIKPYLLKKGYKYLNHGQDQDVYLAPDGTIVKIFGYDRYEGDEISEAQEAFMDFAKYCKANASNPFLPNILGFTGFTFNNHQYLQIKMERMFDFKGADAEYLGDIASRIAAWTTRAKNADYIIKNIISSGWGNWNNEVPKFVTMLGGKEEVALFVKTIVELRQIANANRYYLDLHQQNFMLSSEGHVVISDPFFTGSHRQ